MKNIIKIKALEYGGMVASLVPLGIHVFLERSLYFTTPSSTVAVTSTGFICFALAMMSKLGKLKMPPRIIVFAIIWGACKMLYPIILNTVTIVEMLLIGEGVDLVIFKPLTILAKSKAAQKSNSEQQKTTKQLFVEAMSDYAGKGRV